MKLTHLPRLITCLTTLMSLMPVGQAQVAAPTERPIVVTRAGSVAGTAGEIETFKGIPYAAPPVGALRWRAPQPVTPWKEARDASHFGHDCMQRPYVISTGQKTSEDCLTLSVWTPGRAPGARRPVMVFLYGGGFIGGSGAYPLYDSSKLAANGVVVVAPNYRVGIFGFLAHPALSAESPHKASGNYGLLDQIAALQWVKDNIAGFGGDPERVTVFGESAGAVSIAVLMTSPQAKGLFNQAILHSPDLPHLATLAAAQKSGTALGADLAALRRMSATELLAHNDDFFPQHPIGSLISPSFPAPIVDGYVLPTQPRSAFEAGNVHAVPTIVGIAADEGRMFSPKQTLAGYKAWVKDKFGRSSEELLALNPADTDAKANTAASAILGDAVFGESARLIARTLSQHQPNTFFYLFSRGVGGRAQPATHSEVLPFVFGSLDKPSFIPHDPPDATDLKLSATMQEAWTRFAASGDPNGAGLPHWPKYDRASDPYLEFGKQIHTGEGYRRAELDALAPFFAEVSRRR
ncbi:MAG: carboxylesterase family protein [Sinobacteraceae bacterium]|nr:carboxylesterase family protein [Nevskiaceae bacterium]